MSLTSLPTPTTILAPHEAEHNAVDLTHNTKGSRWDKVGDNELINTDTFRYNYNPVTGLFEGRVIMGSWTNEILDPRDMTTSNWDKVNNVSIARDAVGIDGEANTACTLTDDSSNYEYVRQTKTIPDDSNTHTETVRVKKDDDESRFPNVTMKLTGGSVLEHREYLNTKTGDSATGNNRSDGTATIVDDGDWWKIEISITNDSTGNTTAVVELTPAGSDALDGSTNANATGSTVFDVASLFLDSAASPPTPVYGETAGQSFTQDPDIAKVTDLEAIDYNADEGTFEVRVNKEAGDDNGYIFTLNDDSTDSFWGIRIRNDDSWYLAGKKSDGGVYTETSIGARTGDDRLVVSYKDDFKVSLNGGDVVTDSEISTSLTLSQLTIGNLVSNYLNGSVLELKNYSRELSDSKKKSISR